MASLSNTLLTAITFLLSLYAAYATTSFPPPASSGTTLQQDTQYLSARLTSAVNRTEKFLAKLSGDHGGCPCSIACSSWSAYGSAVDEMNKALEMVVAGKMGEAGVRFSGMGAYSGSCVDCFDVAEGVETEKCSELRRFNKWYHRLLDDCFATMAKYGG